VLREAGVIPQDSGVVPQDSGVVPQDSGVVLQDSSIVLQEGGIIVPDNGVPDASPTFVCDMSIIGTPCTNSGSECGNGGICLAIDDTTGICTCPCAPDDPSTPLVVEDTCPDQANNVCGAIPLVDGSIVGACLKKCAPDLGRNTCAWPIGCHPQSGLSVGVFDSPVCLYPGCMEDADCPVVTAEPCSTHGTLDCADPNAQCLPHDTTTSDGLCVLPGSCDAVSALCGPRADNFKADAAVGDPCKDDTECGAAMACEREVDPGAMGQASGPCSSDSECCSQSCNANGYCLPGSCSVHSRNGYCYIANCAFPTLPEFACPAGSTCNSVFGTGICQKACSLDDAGSCRGSVGDLNGDYECRAYNNLNSVVVLADGPTCDWGDTVDCTIFDISGVDCSLFGDSNNTTHMRCMGLDGVDKNDPYDATGYCLDDTVSGTAWR
ncbi:MAG: hypothetical protein JRH20_29925, partial [Deltaproteobacteria bacterium]|nr:hypothetical protein [Deltaproteobacteria bacterium]